MANLNLEFSQDEHEYSDGDIEFDLLDICKNHNSDEFDEIIMNDRRWPVLYHLSRFRQNILNWYPFKKDAEVLEVGAGCGAITGLLCEKCGHVTAAELTKIRAQINFERNKSFGNLDIYVGDIFKMNFDRKFDYITLIGVLEYAAFMSKSKNPYAEMLNKLKALLNPGGHILIAIENRYGLKYFAGAREDHTGKFFDGVSGYGENARVKTFTKAELSELLCSTGLSEHKFYYPLPDYKFAKVICTDETINDFDSNLNLRSYDNKRLEVFDEQNVMKQLAKENVLGTFSNSFLIDAGASDSSILTEFISVQRKEDFRIITSLEKSGGKRVAIKTPLSEKSRAHLEKMHENYKKFGKIHGLELAECETAQDGRVFFEYLGGESLLFHLESLLAEEDKSGFYKALDRYYDRLLKDTDLTGDFYTPEFKSHFGNISLDTPLHCAKISNLDMNFDNIIMSENGAKIIDYEWIMEFPVPVEYIFWRSFIYSPFIAKDKALLDSLLERYHITPYMHRIFYSWELFFLLKYVKSFDTSIFALDNIKIKQSDYEKCISDKSVSTTVFYDSGSGFNEYEKVDMGKVEDGVEKEFTFKIDGEKPIKALRFDPLEGSFSCCKIIMAQSDLGNVTVVPVNSTCMTKTGDLFLTRDPVYKIDCDFSKVKWIKIKFVAYMQLDTELEHSITERSDQLNNALSELKASYNKLKTSHSELEASYSSLETKYNAVLDSNSWKVTEPMRKFKNMLSK